MKKLATRAYSLLVFRTARGCLSYIVVCNETRDALVIDPSLEAGNEYLHALKKENLTLRYIVDTHTHADHVSAYRELKRKTGAQYMVYTSAPSSHVDVRVKDSDTFSLGHLKVRILHTPGHAADTIALVLPDAVFTADTLLIGGTGRTDLRKNSSARELYDSIWRKIIPLGDSIKVYPGHDYKGRYVTTIGKEKKSNPRVQLSREEFIRVLDAHHPPLPELFEESVRRNSQ